ncbi:MAG: ABC transporter permease [Thermomicrobiales bacterium]|nr:ABC transporter permease [Thermomicrobiales bacterium]MCO5222314.1 ABC transporter permease [Thermomicrobiales bacterium]
MFRFIVRRLLQMIPILFGITVITFIIINAAGSPLQQMEFNPRVKPEDIARIRHNLGLDEPLWKRYFIWVGNVLQGDLGLSLINFRPVTERIREVMFNTLLLSSISITLSLLIAVPLGIYSATHRNGRIDRISSLFAVAGYAIPTVWLGLLLILLFSVQFSKWGLPSLPVGGVRDLRDDGGLGDRIEHLILPITALVLPQVATWLFYIRSNMLEVLQQDYIRAARAKGLRNKTVLYGHGLRNVLIPLVTLFGLLIPDIFAGALVVENVFAYPGMGRLAITAIGDKDHTLVMGITLMFAVLVIVGNLIADVLYAVVDPRIRLD